MHAPDCESPSALEIREPIRRGIHLGRVFLFAQGHPRASLELRGVPEHAPRLRDLESLSSWDAVTLTEVRSDYAREIWVVRGWLHSFLEGSVSASRIFTFRNLETQLRAGASKGLPASLCLH